jgi:hypothetical protein
MIVSARASADYRRPARLDEDVPRLADVLSEHRDAVCARRVALLLLADARGDSTMPFALGFYPGRVVAGGGAASSASGRGEPLAPTSE